MSAGISKKRPAVSVLVPIYNVEKYLDECLSSLINQTLENIEIICLNDGSTDNSLEIVKRYAEKDTRIVVVDKKNSGYGDSMNRGLKQATGEYVGILESDDFIEPEAFEQLYRLAKKNRAEVVRANYYHFLGGENIRRNVVNKFPLGQVVNPREEWGVFYLAPAIWSGIYQREFLEKNKICFLPTPGASYQDTGFSFKVWACCRRAVFTNEAFLHYRLDNEASSVNNPGKVFCVCDEYAEIEKFLRERDWLKELGQVMYACKWGAYGWNIERLAPKMAKRFIRRVKEDYQELELERKYYSGAQWRSLQAVLRWPAGLYLARQALRKWGRRIKEVRFGKKSAAV